MKKSSALILLLSTLALFNGGCGQGEQNSAIPPSPAPVVGQTPAVPVSPSPQAAVPVTAIATAPANIKVFGLIPSTDVKQRQQDIVAGRANPFSLIPIQPQVTLVKPAMVVIKKPITNSKDGHFKSGNVTDNKLRNMSSSRYATYPRPPIPPLLPSPSEAKAVEILGVLQIGNQPFAIVQAPGESVPRYVSTGASLVNGQVQVKSINSSTENPTVTLEQYGQEVIRAVGQAPDKPAAKMPAIAPTESQTSDLPKELGELNRLSLKP